MNNDMETTTVPENADVSQIRQFYADKTIFLTGCTGFIGNCILEKLLRQCPEIKRIYILMRTKRNVSAEERMTSFFQNIIFEKLHVIHPNFKSKIIMVHGDLMEPNMGLSTEDLNLLTNCVNIIIHNAANVLFNETMKIALQTNVLATQVILELANTCNHLEAFMYVSTAFSHCYMKHIDEKFHSPPADLKKIHDLIKMDGEHANKQCQKANSTILGKWVNTYTFSKASAEGLVNEFAKTASFPCGIFKPSIVWCTYKEPIRGWCRNQNTPSYAMIAFGLGLIHATLLSDPVFDLVPVDMTTNCLLAAIWDLSVYNKGYQESRFYNYASSTVRPLKLRQIEVICKSVFHNAPSINAKWYYFVVKSNNYYLFYIFHILLHFIPAMFIDIFNILRLRKPIALPIFFKVHNNMDQLLQFSEGDWRIEVTSMLKVWDRMNVADHQQFHSDLRTLDWEDYLSTCWIGVRRFLLNEPVDTIKIAKERYRRLKILHYGMKTLLQMVFLYLIFRMIINFAEYY